eukprot:m.182539 g.182539  ORF g.182539 m.182539 type:complete len:226 (-) comp32119_c11_seq1:254-931(-)
MPVGRRLAVALAALTYGSKKPFTGPTISGCELHAANNTLVVKFNVTLLRGDPITITRRQTAITPVPAKGLGSIADSSLMQVCTGSAEDCGCMSWNDNSVHPKKPPLPGWTCEIPSDGSPERQPQLIRGDIWADAPISLLGDGASVVVDASNLNMTMGGVHAVKFGWSFMSGACCVDQLTLDGLSPCIPGSCGLMTRDSLLPVNPFFATVTPTNKCKCPLPQTCDE